MLQNKIRSFQPKVSSSYKQFIINQSTENVDDENEKRSLYLKLGVLANYKGSAYMEFGKTKMICVVFPPQEPPKNHSKAIDSKAIQCTVQLAPFCSKDDSQNTLKRQKSYAIALKKALEPFIFRQEFLTFKVGIHVLVLEDNGYILSTALNCCCAALAEGGIPIYDLCTASTSIKIIKDEMDFVNSDEQLINNITTFSSQNQVSECYQKGYVSLDTFKMDVLETTKKNESMLSLIRSVLLNSLMKR